jgi:hypothetical protein
MALRMKNHTFTSRRGIYSDPLSDPFQGCAVCPCARFLGLAGITAGYVVIFVVVFDYSRWVSNWAVCMFPCMLALKLVSAPAREGEVPLRRTIRPISCSAGSRPPFRGSG